MLGRKVIAGKILSGYFIKGIMRDFQTFTIYWVKFLVQVLYKMWCLLRKSNVPFFHQLYLLSLHMDRLSVARLTTHGGTKYVSKASKMLSRPRRSLRQKEQEQVCSKLAIPNCNFE